MRAKRVALVMVAGVGVATFWPWLGNPFNYVHLRDSIRTSIPVALVLGEPCATYKAGFTIYDSSPNCYRFDQPKRFVGIWLYEFEGSTFLENGTYVPTKRPPYAESAWLMSDPADIDPKPDYDNYDEERDCYPIHAFQVEFIGRRSPSGQGHMGLFGSEIWVQKMLSAKALTAPDCKTYSTRSTERS